MARTVRAIASAIRQVWEIYPDEAREVLSRICDEKTLSRKPLPYNKIASEIYEVMHDNLVTYKSVVLPDDFVDVVAFLFAKAVELELRFQVRTWYAIDWHGIENGEWSFWFTCVDLKTNACLLPEIVRLIEFRKPSDFLSRLEEVLNAIRTGIQKNHRWR